MFKLIFANKLHIAYNIFIKDSKEKNLSQHNLFTLRFGLIYFYFIIFLSELDNVNKKGSL